MPSHLATIVLAAAAASSPVPASHAVVRHAAARVRQDVRIGVREDVRIGVREDVRVHSVRRPPRPAAPTRAHAAGDPAVTVSDFRFAASTTRIRVGDTITWTNDGPSAHTATARNGSFDTGTLKPGQSASHTFTRPGTYAYICSIHPFMHGTVIVTAAATNAPGAAKPRNPSTANPSTANTTTSTTTAATTAPTTTTRPSPPPTAPTPAPAKAATSGPKLPATGMDLLSALAVGAVLLVAGLALRRAVGP